MGIAPFFIWLVSCFAGNAPTLEQVVWLGDASGRSWNPVMAVEQLYPDGFVVQPTRWVLDPAEAADAKVWLNAPGCDRRTLVVGPDTLAEFGPWNIQSQQITGLTNGEQAWKFLAPLSVSVCEPNERGTALLMTPSGEAVTWKQEIRPGRVLVYCGLPFGTLSAAVGRDRPLSGATADFLAQIGFRHSN